MKHIFTFVLLFAWIYSLAQTDALEKANALINEKKYESAYMVLDEADPSNQDPAITMAKTDLFLNYFVTSIMHQIFALKDLEPDEDLMDIRGSDGSYSMFAFAPDSVLLRLIERYPENYALRKSLGNYYHEVHLKYTQNWLEPDTIVIRRFFENYKLAFDNGVFDYWSLYGMGYAYLLKQEYEKAIPFFEQSVSLKDDEAPTHYNLAYAYLFTDQREKCIESAGKALKLYDYPAYKADAARMIAVCWTELDEPEKSLEYYLQANEIQPEDYYTLKPLLELEVRLDKKTYPERTREFFLLAPGNPTIYQDLIGIYMDYDKAGELLDFLDSQHKTYKDDNKVNGNLYFYKAVIQYDMEDFKMSKTNFEKARAIFKEVYAPGHRVFNVIDSYTEEM